MGVHVAGHHQAQLWIQEPNQPLHSLLNTSRTTLLSDWGGADKDIKTLKTASF